MVRMSSPGRYWRSSSKARPRPRTREAWRPERRLWTGWRLRKLKSRAADSSATRSATDAWTPGAGSADPPAERRKPFARPSAPSEKANLFHFLEVARLPAAVERRPLGAVDPDVGEPAPPGRGLDPALRAAGRRGGADEEIDQPGHRRVLRLEQRAHRPFMASPPRDPRAPRFCRSRRPSANRNERWGTSRGRRQS